MAGLKPQPSRNTTKRAFGLEFKTVRGLFDSKIGFQNSNHTPFAKCVGFRVLPDGMFYPKRIADPRALLKKNRAPFSIFTPQYSRVGDTTFCPDRDKRLQRPNGIVAEIRGVPRPVFRCFPSYAQEWRAATRLGSGNFF
jgi:hypothetical protein